MSEKQYLVVTDGGYKNGLSYGSFRVFDDAGLTIEHKQFIIGLGTNNQAEYMAILNALKWCLDNGLKRVHILTDSRLAVKQVRGEWRTRDSALKNLVEKVRKYEREFETFTIEFVPNKYVKQKLGH